MARRFLTSTPDRLARLVHRAAGLGVGAFTIGLGRVAWSAAETAQWGALAVLAPIVLGGIALTVYCFSPARGLDDLG